MVDPRRTVRIQLPTGIIWAEVESIGDVSRRHDVSISERVLEPLAVDTLRTAIEGVAEVVQQAVAAVKPDNASVELGLELAVESGKLTALWVKGTGKANLKITLTWGK